MNAESLLALIRERIHHPSTPRELLQKLKIPREERPSFKRLLAGLVASGDLIETRGNRFGLPDRMNLVVGRITTNPRGFGFVVPDRPLDDVEGDIYIAGSNLNQAMHGDRVVARVERISDKGAEGRILRILERGSSTIVGRYDMEPSGFGFVVPFDRRMIMDVQIPPEDRGAAEPGDMVLVEITRWPTAAAARWAGSTKCSATSTSPASTPRSSFASTASPTRTARGCGRRGDAPRRRGRRTRPRGPDRLPAADRPSRSTASTRATSTTRSRSTGCRTATTARRPHRRCRALRDGGQRARRRSLRARHVGVFPRARRPHVPGGAVDRPLQPESARRPAGPVLPDGHRPARHGRALRTARRRDPQRRADDLHRCQRHPDRQAIRRSRNGISALVPLFETMRELFEILNARRRRRGSIDFDLKEPEIVLDDRGHGRGHHRGRAQRRAPDHRGVHAGRQRDGGAAPRRSRRADALSHPRGSGSAEGRGVRGVHLDARLQPGRAGRRREAARFPEAGRADARHAGREADRLPDAAHHAEGALRPVEHRPLRPGRVELHALHLADSPLSRPGRASHVARVPARPHGRGPASTS